MNVPSREFSHGRAPVAVNSTQRPVASRIVRAALVLSLVATAYVALLAPNLRADDPQQSTVVGTRSVSTAVVTAITSKIVIDGSLEEAVWETAPKIGDLTQREPHQGEKPTERTEVTLLHDANNLYIGVMCYDSEP